MTSVHGSLRALAVQADADSAREIELGVLWERLSAGEWVFQDTFSTSDRCYAVLHGPDERRPPSPRKLVLLRSLLLGGAVKVVAMEHHRAESSVTTAAQGCLRALGLDCTVSHAPVLLAMAAMASSRSKGEQQQCRLSHVSWGGEPRAVVSALRPDRRFPVRLSAAEAAVLRSLVSGQSYAQISGERARSPRTIANQLATAFRKLGVSGRRATVGVLIQHSARSS